MTTPPYIFGIDPGLLHTGWGLIALRGNELKIIDSGTISPPVKNDLPERLTYLYHKLDDIVTKHHITSAAIEEGFTTKYHDATLKLGHARAIGLLVLSLHGYKITPYAAKTIKRAITGKGSASKDQMMMMIKTLLGGYHADSDHAADALAVAICHAYSQQTLEKWH